MTLLRQFLILCLVASLFYLGLGSYPLLDNNEGLYTEIAREMRLLHDYIIPHLNFVPYLEKPPLLYWLLSASMRVWGENAMAARLVTASAGFFTCLTLFLLGRRSLRQETAILAAIVLATAVGFQLLAREVFFDVLLTACFTVAMLSFYGWYRTHNPWLLRLSYGFVGLAILAKGILSILLAGGIALSFMLTTRMPWQQAKRFLDGWGIGLMLLIAVPWHVAASMQHDNFAWYYFINEHVLRFLNLREPHDYYQGTVFYYLPRLFGFFWPWCWLLPAVIWDLRSALPWRGNLNHSEAGLRWFLWLWLLIPLMFFSFSSAKANYYMVIGMPPLAILLAIKIQTWVTTHRYQPLMISYGLSLLLWLTVLLSAPLWLPQKLPDYLALLPLATGFGYATLVLAVCGFLVFYGLRKHPLTYLVGHGILACLFFGFVLAGLPKVNQHLSQAALVRCLNSYPARPLYLFEEYEKFSSLAFYRQQQLILIDSQSNDLAYGQHYAQPGWFISQTELQQTLINKHPIQIAIARDKLNQFKQLYSNDSFIEVCGNKRLVILENS